MLSIPLLTQPCHDPVLNSDALHTPVCVCVRESVHPHVCVCVFSVCRVYLPVLLGQHCCKHSVTELFLGLLVDCRGDSVVRAEWNVWQTSSRACVYTRMCVSVRLAAALCTVAYAPLQTWVN